MVNILNKKKYCASACKWCCNDLQNLITFLKEPESGKIVLYEPVWRGFSIPFGESQEGGIRVHIEHCPFCGGKLPSGLEDQWWKILKQEHDLVRKEGEPYEEFKSRLPLEFHTDEWWMRRGL